MKSIVLLLGLCVCCSLAYAQDNKISGYEGTYNLSKEIIVNVEELTESNAESHNLKVSLTIYPDGNISWGGGKSHNLKLIRDLDSNGYADYIEESSLKHSVTIHYTLQVLDDYFVLYSTPYHGKIIKYYFNR